MDFADNLLKGVGCMSFEVPMEISRAKRRRIRRRKLTNTSPEDLQSIHHNSLEHDCRLHPKG